VSILRLCSEDGTNRLTRACVLSLTAAIRELTQKASPLVLTGTQSSSPQERNSERSRLSTVLGLPVRKNGTDAHAGAGTVPAPVYPPSRDTAWWSLDLALACHRRIASPHAVLDTAARPWIDYRMGRHASLPRLVGKPSLWKCLWRRKDQRDAGAGNRLVEAVADTRSPKLYEGSRQTSKKENSRAPPLAHRGGTRHSPVSGRSTQLRSSFALPRSCLRVNWHEVGIGSQNL